MLGCKRLMSRGGLADNCLRGLVARAPIMKRRTSACGHKLNVDVTRLCEDSRQAVRIFQSSAKSLVYRRKISGVLLPPD